MVFETKVFYKSPNGDRWLLVRESDSARVFIRHIPNLPSGGKPSVHSFVSGVTAINIRSYCG